MEMNTEGMEKLLEKYKVRSQRWLWALTRDSLLNDVAQGFRKSLTIWLVDWLKLGPKEGPLYAN